MACIIGLLKELKLSEKWERAESPTLYNGEIIPFTCHSINPKGGYINNGNIIVKCSNNIIQWTNTTIIKGKHVTQFEARFNCNGYLIDLDINYFDGFMEKNIYDKYYINRAIKETIKHIQKEIIVFAQIK